MRKLLILSSLLATACNVNVNNTEAQSSNETKEQSKKRDCTETELDGFSGSTTNMGGIGISSNMDITSECKATVSYCDATLELPDSVMKATAGDPNQTGLEIKVTGSKNISGCPANGKNVCSFAYHFTNGGRPTVYFQCDGWTSLATWNAFIE